MKTFVYLLNSVALVLASSAAHAQHVKGNQAVTVLPDGSRKVETPPVPANILAAPCLAKEAGCAGGGWKMLETPSGLMECTEVFARPGTCRASTFGSEKRSRSWIVKSKGQWMQCERPEISGKCVNLKSLPVSAVQ